MKIGLIGLGMVAETHVRAIADAPALHLSAVLSRDADRAQSFVDRLASRAVDAPTVYLDIGAFAASDIDFALVCTPPDARADIVEACEAASLPLGIVFQHRMRQSSRDLAALLSSGRLGPIAAVEIAVPWWRDQSYYDTPWRGTYARDGGGVLLTQAIHTLDLALTYTGRVARVQAMARTTALHTMEAEDFVTAGLEFTSGAVGSLTASTASRPGGSESITLHCAHGSARLAGGQLAVDWQDGTSETIGEAAITGGGADPMAFTHAWHQAVIADFAAALREGRPPACTGRDALRVHALIDAIALSSKQGRTVGLCP